MSNSDRKIISIELYKEAPKIILKFSNTGSPILKEKWDTIFQQGYSEANSTGQGLFAAREMLKKYGGRIYVSKSNSDITTFKIELNEGII
jgi:sensor histidine kinase regulating citrate/malate metabolism